MRTIKTRSTVKSIKLLDKSVNASKRMKDAFIRTKNTAEETQEPQHDTPINYATEKVQYTAQSAVQKTIYNSTNPLRKVNENWDRAKGHCQEVFNVGRGFLGQEGAVSVANDNALFQGLKLHKAQAV
ncbi:hypothetical protein FACS1894171_2970 [Clostridia bacterium]|nr:hypothetical protein FACS1894171_2970 [Clostridia bacterium]